VHSVLSFSSHRDHRKKKIRALPRRQIHSIVRV
jgi:hypothetical protein